MSNITKPIVLDETAQQIVAQLARVTAMQGPPGDIAAGLINGILKGNGDETVSKAEPGVDYSVGIPNRNLLDNPFFTVNQRGQTSYTGNDGYTVDRWKSSGSVGTAAKDDHGITLQAETNNFCLKEPLEKLSAGSYTLSAYTSDFSGENIQFQISYKKNGTGHWDSYPIGHVDGLSQCTFAVTDDMTELSVGFKLNNGTVRIEAVKLELGSISTLANDIEPDYGMELAKCQRYYYKLKADTYCTARTFSSDASKVEFAIPTPVPMAGLPAAAFGDLSTVGIAYCNGVERPFSTLSINTSGTGDVCVNATAIISSGFSVTMPVTVVLKADVSLSADL